MNDTARKALVAEYEGAGLDPQLLALLQDPVEPFDDELQWAVGNPREAEAVEAIARRVAARRARLAHEPKRFTVRRLKANDAIQAERAPYMAAYISRHPWAAVDSTRPHWVKRAKTFDDIVAAIDAELAPVRTLLDMTPAELSEAKGAGPVY